jgi:hypothetical protein
LHQPVEIDVEQSPFTARPSLRLILRRVRQRPFVLKDLAQITAINPAAAGRAFDKVLGLVFRPSAHELADIPATRRVDHRSNRLSRSAWAKQQSREEENHGD